MTNDEDSPESVKRPPEKMYDWGKEAESPAPDRAHEPQVIEPGSPGFVPVPTRLETSDTEWRSLTVSVIGVFPAYFVLQGIANVVIR